MSSACEDREAHERELLEKDVEAIGEHCDISSCHRLDFLPFKCESCKGTYCLDHRTETAHLCAKEGLWATQRRAKSSSPSTSTPAAARTAQTLGVRTRPCAKDRCKTIVNRTRDPGVVCPTCRKTFCLTHRLADAHACTGPPPAPAAVAAQERARSALNRFKAWTAGKSETFAARAQERVAAGRSGGSAVAEVMKMKREAKGDATVATDKRVYLYVEAEARTTTAGVPRGVFWYNRDWSIGKVLDKASAGLQVKNVNNQGQSEETRLRVFHVEGGRVLSFGEKLSDAVTNGNTIVLLRGLQMPDLLE